MFAIDNFKSYLDALVADIAKRKGLSGPRNRLKAISKTELTDHRERYFPSDDLPLPSSILRQEDFDDIKRKLALARGLDGRICLSGGEIKNLEEKYSAYLKAVIASPRAYPKDFDNLVQAHGFRTKDLSDPFRFRRFVQATIQAPSTDGRRELVRVNSSLFLAALLRDGGLRRQKNWQDQLEVFLTTAAISLHRLGDPAEGQLLTLMTLLHEKNRSPLLYIRLKCHEHLNQPDSDAAADAVRVSRDWNWTDWAKIHGGGEYKLAFELGVRNGFSISDKPYFLRGPLGDCFYEERLLEDEYIAEWSLLQSDATMVSYIAQHNGVESTLEASHAVRMAIEKISGEYPHLEVKLLIDEAASIFSAKEDLGVTAWALVVDKLHHARRIQRRHSTEPVDLIIRRVHPKLERLMTMKGLDV